MGHGKGIGAVCDPTAFDGVVIVEPNILGPKHGSVGIELVEPGYETELAQHIGLDGVYQRHVFQRQGRPWVVITIQR